VFLVAVVCQVTWMPRKAEITLLSLMIVFLHGCNELVNGFRGQTQRDTIINVRNQDKLAFYKEARLNLALNKYTGLEPSCQVLKPS
jgi:hypothetical protein